MHPPQTQFAPPKITLHPLTSKGGAFVLKLGLVFKVGKHRKVSAGFFHTPQHVPVAQSHIPQGAPVFASIFLNFYNGRKWHTVNVERTAFIGYTTNIAILQKLLERYCKPSHAKKRDGSFLSIYTTSLFWTNARGFFFAARWYCGRLL